MPTLQSENSYIANEVLPLLASGFGYPFNNSTQVKINDVPIFRASGARSGATIDIVYYWNNEPVLLIEAKREYRSHEAALKQALDYLRNFPVGHKEFAPSGMPPKFLATTVGKEIKCYKWAIDYSKPIPDFLTEEVDILPFPKLLEYYGLSERYEARVLDAVGFKTDFFDELVAIFKTDAKELKITTEIIKKVSLQILNFLAHGHKFVSQPPYVDLTIQRQKAVRDLFNRFNLASSLGVDIAHEFRRAILRSFQGGGFNQYLTEQCIIAFMVDLLGGFRPETKVLDFECGSGGFIAAAVERGVSLENIRGVDIEELPYIVAKTYLALYFKKTGEWIDALPVKKENGLLDQGSNWDVIIGNPAGGNKYEHGDIKRILKEGLQNLRMSKNKKGKYSDYELSIQQSIKSTRVGGKICLILPEGFFSNSHDEFLRKYVAKHCKILTIVSLPRGVFKKGTSTKHQGGGARTASMKMSILCAQKTRELDKKIPFCHDDFFSLDYPVFMASVSEPASKNNAVCDWLEPQLDLIFDQWREWNATHELKMIPRVEIMDATKEKKAQPLTLFNKKTTDKSEKPKPPTHKSTTKINESLKNIFS